MSPVSGYLKWMDAQIDPAAGVSLWGFYWRYKLLYLAHLFPFFLLMLGAEWAGADRTSATFLTILVLFAVVALIFPIFLFARRVILKSRARSAAVATKRS